MRRRPTVWTELLDEYVMKARGRGDSLRMVAAAIGCSVDAVAHRYFRLCAARGIKKFDFRKKQHLGRKAA